MKVVLVVFGEEKCRQEQSLRSFIVRSIPDDKDRAAASNVLPLKAARTKRKTQNDFLFPLLAQGIRRVWGIVRRAGCAGGNQLPAFVDGNLFHRFLGVRTKDA